LSQQFRCAVDPLNPAWLSFSLDGVHMRMSYYLQALIGKADALGKHTSDFQSARLVPLTQGMALIPLTDELHDEIGSGGEVEPFEKLSPGVEQWAQRISFAARIAYIEAEFFGGDGGQYFSVRCGGGDAAVGIHGAAATYVDRVGLWCKDTGN